ncbi:MAG: DegT/DnrJ/EryC1/StrS family aminotransferase [Candidatus Bathyarchaeota archaeon]|nr:DegT/DnrJ/EryC1/StrS family aminotransferase [Candidatus Termiticorpusculum sp.]
MSGFFVRSSRPYFSESDVESILDEIGLVLVSGQLRNGENLKLFQRGVADYVGVRHAVALDSDLSALETALSYYQVKGKEVIVCTNSFVSVPNSVLYAGGKIVFADINKNTLAMDVESFKQKISAKTCGVIVTHIAGFPNEALEEIKEVCDERGFFLIEDATHALGASIGGRKVGTFGDASVFASTPTKIITTGEGGVLVTNNDELAEYAKLFSYYGSGLGKTNFERLGRHMLLPEISAVVGINQLCHVEEFLEMRNSVAKAYDEAFSKIAGLSIVSCKKGNRCSYYKYPLTLGKKIDKNRFVKALKELGVETGTVFYPPCHMQPFYKEQNSHGLPLLVAEDVLAHTITLPMHCALDVSDVSAVIENVQSVMKT